MDIPSKTFYPLEPLYCVWIMEDLLEDVNINLILKI